MILKPYKTDGETDTLHIREKKDKYYLVDFGKMVTDEEGNETFEVISSNATFLIGEEPFQLTQAEIDELTGNNQNQV